VVTLSDQAACKLRHFIINLAWAISELAPLREVVITRCNVPRKTKVLQSLTESCASAINRDEFYNAHELIILGSRRQIVNMSLRRMVGVSNDTRMHIYLIKFNFKPRMRGKVMHLQTLNAFACAMMNAYTKEAS
jgi:hypothetical protein